MDWRYWGLVTNHRGPDAFGFWNDDCALLGHNRLAIIDLSTAANQPMLGLDARHVIVFNGEIFNYTSLRSELSASGVRFETESDTEVLLNGYRLWGRAVLDKLDGMFAFAIWDTIEQTLFAARDHVGIKPFFYRHRLGQLAFGSELKILTALGDEKIRLRKSSIFEYLLYSYIPAPFTPYEGYLKLEPGHCLEYDQKNDRLTTSHWFHVPLPVHTNEIDRREAQHSLRQTFRKAVTDRMISDVPLGAFLSGGVDSSIIVAEMAAVSPSVQTFSIGYKKFPEYDESEYAQLVAHSLGVKHRVLYPEFDQVDISRYVDLVVRHFDEPYGNPTVVLTHLLTAAAREHVTVALVGDGGDELFAGYPRHLALLLAQRSRAALGPFAPSILRLLRNLPETPHGNHRIRRMRRFFESLGKPLGEAFQDWTSLFPVNVMVGRMIGMNSIPEGTRLNYIRSWFDLARSDPIASAGYADLNSFLPYNLLEGADRMSMANGFELRLPFMSKSMVEFAASVPSRMKTDGKIGKIILKEAYRGALPSVILARKKRGFNPPVWNWLQQNRDYVSSLILDTARILSYIDKQFVVKMLDDFFAHRADHSTQIWALLVLERWLDALPSSVSE